MKKPQKTVALIILFLSVSVYCNDDKELNYEFTQRDTYYSFRGSFYIEAEFNCPIDLIYNFENISNYALGAKSIELVQQGENWFDVAFTYRKFIIIENKSTWRRTLKKNEHKIIFELLSNRNNIDIIPKMKNSTGYYQIYTENGCCYVEYFQECELYSGFLKGAYISGAEREAVKFLEALKEHLIRVCD